MRERQTDAECVEEGQREGGTESEADSRLRAVIMEPDEGLKPTDCEIMTPAEVGWLNRATQVTPRWLRVFIRN